MNVLYKCRCMEAETEITVPDRRPDSDILPWMEMVTGCISTDHRALSPNCRATELEYAKFPINEAADGIGMKPRVQ